MKTTKSLFLTLALALTGTFAFAQNGTITGSAHDFKAEGWSGGEICKVCHTPHNALHSDQGAPLWDHLVTTETFTPYADTGTLDATVGVPTGTSKLCLSCHDGVTNVDAFGGDAGTGNISTLFTGTTASLGVNLTTHHPISLTYNATLATTDGGLHNPTTTDSGITAQIDDDMLFGTGNDQLECASCHDVHNNGPSGVSFLLVKTNADSALCLTCHNK
ncbi:cytochrome c3 family protein [Aestuariivivens marinum]|uniref:cytochrome c3 family protein n=1 Tax=Aestuariivivens marinum TaxID=2913555 RepID=UPI001F55C630|nr:cytochrome c3 family protein [Aestuariivivens marinum]